MKPKNKENDKLKAWQEKITADETAYSKELALMEEREKIFQGSHDIRRVLDGDEITETPYVRNIVDELIESQINVNIPSPKVTPLHREDEELARLIEDMLRNKLDKLPSESINDLMERTVPVQGGSYITYDWDNERGTHTTVGEGVMSYRHPKQLIPQQGITSDIADMDHVALKIPQTAEYIKRRYDIDVSGVGEDDPGLRSADGASDTVPDMVDQYMVYFKNDGGGIGLFSWVRDAVLIDLEDYQARHLRRCCACGCAEPAGNVEPLDIPSADGKFPLGAGEPLNGNEWDVPDDTAIVQSGAGRGRCPYCGGVYKDGLEDYFELSEDVALSDGATAKKGERVPYYKPDIYPIFLQRNVSAFGKLLGDSDVDKIADQQNLTNRAWAKIIAQLINAGSYITMPDDLKIKKDSTEGKRLALDSPAKANMIKVIDLTANIEPSIVAKEEAYREAQQLIGITDSYLGRRDTTATSGRAKEFSAAQSAGRLESKRTMKNEMYSRLFEAMFKFELAYADEKRPVIGEDIRGNRRDSEWDKLLFLRRDAANAYYWNTDFLFSVDSTAPLAQNRGELWKETRSHFESGAFGDPTQTKTQIMYWEQMATLHYPGAGRTKQMLVDEQEKQAKLAIEQAKAQKEAAAYADNAVTDLESELPAPPAPMEAAAGMPATEFAEGGEML
ncbi:MAG: hypothetical protein RR394_07660 [Oscillospiraceae bacterium]